MVDPPLRGTKVAVVTVSDSVSRSLREDVSGPVAAGILAEAGAQSILQEVVADHFEAIEKVLKRLSDDGADLIVTTGGTGVARTDVTPDVTSKVCDRLVPGISEAMRSASLSKTPHAILSRAVCGTRGQSLIVNLPGSPGGVRDCLNAVVEVLPHAIGLLKSEPTEHIQT